ncbi:hypothetical protein [Methanosarcina sp. DH2]|nr:hypothetical protein [Methanosarcina sp. DH2]
MWLSPQIFGHIRLPAGIPLSSWIQLRVTVDVSDKLIGDKEVENA